MKISGSLRDKLLAVIHSDSDDVEKLRRLAKLGENSEPRNRADHWSFIFEKDSEDDGGTLEGDEILERLRNLTNSVCKILPKKVYQTSFELSENVPRTTISSEVTYLLMSYFDWLNVRSEDDRQEALSLIDWREFNTESIVLIVQCLRTQMNLLPNVSWGKDAFGCSLVHADEPSNAKRERVWFQLCWNAYQMSKDDGEAWLQLSMTFEGQNALLDVVDWEEVGADKLNGPFRTCKTLKDFERQIALFENSQLGFILEETWTKIFDLCENYEELYYWESKAKKIEGEQYRTNITFLLKDAYFGGRDFWDVCEKLGRASEQDYEAVGEPEFLHLLKLVKEFEHALEVAKTWWTDYDYRSCPGLEGESWDWEKAIELELVDWCKTSEQCRLIAKYIHTTDAMLDLLRVCIDELSDEPLKQVILAFDNFWIFHKVFEESVNTYGEKFYGDRWHDEFIYQLGDAIEILGIDESEIVRILFEIENQDLQIDWDSEIKIGNFDDLTTFDTPIRRRIGKLLK